jgi:predicted dehydrogenase
MCEKPMAMSAKEAEEMQAAADKNGKLLMLGFVTRFSKEATIAKDFIDKGYLTIEREVGDKPEVDIKTAVDFLRKNMEEN